MGPPYSSPLFKVPTVSAFQPIKEGLTETEYTDQLYTLFDREYTVALSCTMPTCPVLTVDCNPPYDWAPKQYSFYYGQSIGTELFIMPKVKDCLGRNMRPYGDKNTVRMPSGATHEDILEDLTLIKDALQEPTTSNAGGF